MLKVSTLLEIMECRGSVHKFLMKTVDETYKYTKQFHCISKDHALLFPFSFRAKL